MLLFKCSYRGFIRSTTFTLVLFVSRSTCWRFITTLLSVYLACKFILGTSYHKFARAFPSGLVGEGPTPRQSGSGMAHTSLLLRCVQMDSSGRR